MAGALVRMDDEQGHEIGLELAVVWRSREWHKHFRDHAEASALATAVTIFTVAVW